MHQFDRLVARCIIAHKIRYQTLVVHVREDELTSLKSTKFPQEILVDAHVVVLENSYHTVCVDNDCDQLINSVLKFSGYLPAPARRPTPATFRTPDLIADTGSRCHAAPLPDQSKAAPENCCRQQICWRFS